MDHQEKTPTDTATEADAGPLEDGDEILTDEEVARWLKISPKHAAVLRHRKELPFFYVAPRTPRYSRRALERHFRRSYSEAE